MGFIEQPFQGLPNCVGKVVQGVVTDTRLVLLAHFVYLLKKIVYDKIGRHPSRPFPSVHSSAGSIQNAQFVFLMFLSLIHYF